MSRGKNPTRKEVKKMVIHCLHFYPETRNSDTELAIRLWKDFYNQHIYKDEMIELEALHNVPSIKTISRVRRRVQNEEGRYLPTRLAVAKKRRISEEEWREWSNEKAERPSLFKK